MEWIVIRNRFIRLREGRKLTQDQVAIRGKLKQGYVSKLESNLNQGPSVETFVKAVEGLGMTLTDFFGQIERQNELGRTKSVLKGDSPSVTVTKVASGETPTLPEHSSVYLADLAKACLDAAEGMDRGVTRRILAELAFAFGMAADSSDTNRKSLIEDINNRVG